MTESHNLTAHQETVTLADPILRWAATPFVAVGVLFGSFIGGAVAEAILAPLFRSSAVNALLDADWRSGLANAATAFVIVVASSATAPAFRRTVSLVVYGCGAALAYAVLRTWYFPEYHPRAYQTSPIPLYVTLAGGAIGVAVVWWRTFQPQFFPRFGRTPSLATPQVARSESDVTMGISPRRQHIARVAMFVSAVGAVCGGVIGSTLLGVELFSNSLLRSKDGLLLTIVAGGGFGAIVGAIGAPLVAFGLLRHVPLRLTIGVTAIGTIIGAILGAGPPVGAFGGVLGFVVSAIALRLVHRSRRKTSQQNDENVQTG